MKVVQLYFLFFFGILCSSASHAGQDSLEHLDNWITPILGTYSLTGSTGCDQTKLLLWHTGPESHNYQIYIDGYGHNLFYVDDVSIDGNELSYSHRSRSGAFGCMSHRRTKVKITKDHQGKLATIYVRDQSAPDGCVVLPGSWTTNYEAECRAR